MTDFDYKKYSLENLENWLYDAMSCGDATPQEIYDVIVNVVKDNYYTYKKQASESYELLALLNGVKTLDLDLSSLYRHDYIHFNTDPAGNQIDFLNSGIGNTGYSYTSCGVGDTSDYCTNSWNSFWEENSYQEEYNVREQEYYDKEDKKDKVVKWQLPVQVDGLTGDCYVEFPDDLLERAGLKEGDTVEWIDRNDGSFEMRKVNGPE